MDYTKNATDIAIFSLLILTIILMICSSQKFSYKSLPFPPAVSDFKDELQIALEKASMADKTVIIAVVNEAYVEHYENQYPTMFDLFLEGFWAGEGTRSLLDHLLVVAMDEKAYQRCEFQRLNCYRLPAAVGGDLAGEKIYMSGEFIEMMWRRTGFLLELLKRGYSFIFTDIDVIWLRNPLLQLSPNQIYDLQISSDTFNGNTTFTDNPLNTGFYLIRSNNRTISLFEAWYVARFNSTGLKEQDVLMELVKNGMLDKLGIHTRFLETRYFSGFCQNSDDVRSVTTVHANCCRTIRAKVIDLKNVLADWKRFKTITNNNTTKLILTNKFIWSKHKACMDSWI